MRFLSTYPIVILERNQPSQWAGPLLNLAKSFSTKQLFHLCVGKVHLNLRVQGLTAENNPTDSSLLQLFTRQRERELIRDVHVTTRRLSETELERFGFFRVFLVGNNERWHGSARKRLPRTNRGHCGVHS